MQRRRDNLILYALLLVLWGLLTFGGRQLSFSMDEPTYFAAGYAFLARGRAADWLYPHIIAPPLLNSLEALPFYISEPAIPLEQLDGWGSDLVAYTSAFLPYAAPLPRTEVLARTPVMLLTVLLGALVTRWSRELGGRRAGWLALTLLVFDPTLLAHGRLANTDMGLVAIGTAALYTTWRWQQRPQWRSVLLAGAALGLALLAKFSAFLWVGVFGLMALDAIVRHWPDEGRRRLAQTVMALVVAGVLVWLAFGFTVGSVDFVPLPLPAPAYWTAFVNQLGTTDVRVVVAFGKLWTGRQLWYFPLNILIKNPLPLLIALSVGVTVALRRRRSDLHLRSLLVFPVIYSAISIFIGMNVSYRHFYPVHPQLYIVAAVGLATLIVRLRKLGRVAAGVFGAWYVIGALAIYPNELSYFNELVGGPDGGYRYLVDYTRDWGQAYKQLRTYLVTHPGPKPGVITFTAADPSYYDIDYYPIWPTAGALRTFAPFYPQPGRYVMGDVPLYGLAGPDPQRLDWFRRAIPTAIVGHSLFVYDVDDRPSWVAQCITPTTPLTDDAIVEGFGMPTPSPQDYLRRASFDCTAAWLYPASDDPGIYAIHGTLLRSPARHYTNLPLVLEPSDPFIARHLADARLIYAQVRAGELSPFGLFEQPGLSSTHFDPPALLPATAAPADMLPDALRDLPGAPVVLDGPLAYLGVRVVPGSDDVELETWWQVTAPVTRSFSIMAHLLDSQGQVISVADGFGIPPIDLRPGDTVVQRHRFALQPVQAFAWLRTGAYWFDTMSRWHVTTTPSADALFVVLLRPD